MLRAVLSSADVSQAGVLAKVDLLKSERVLVIAMSVFSAVCLYSYCLLVLGFFFVFHILSAFLTNAVYFFAEILSKLTNLCCLGCITIIIK